MGIMPLRIQLQQVYLQFCTSKFQEYLLCRVETWVHPLTILLSHQLSPPLSHLFSLHPFLLLFCYPLSYLFCHHPFLLLSWLILIQALYFPILIRSFLPSSKGHLPPMSFLILNLYFFLKDWVFSSSLTN